MMRMTGYAVVAIGLAFTPIHAEAQQPVEPTQARSGAAGGPGVEMILRQRERLELTQSQVDQLDKIRAEAVQRRVAEQAEMAEMRSKLLAGDIKPEEVRTALQSKREGAGEVRKSERERVESVLNDAQKQKIQTWLGEARAFRRGQASARQGQGGAMRRPMRDQGRRMRGPGQEMMRGRGQGMMRGPGQEMMRGPGQGMMRGPGKEMMRGPGMAPPPRADTVPTGSGS